MRRAGTSRPGPRTAVRCFVPLRLRATYMGHSTARGLQVESQRELKGIGWQRASLPIEVELCHKAEKACISAQLTLFFANSWIGEQIASLEEKCRTASRRMEKCEKE